MVVKHIPEEVRADIASEAKRENPLNLLLEIYGSLVANKKFPAIEDNPSTDKNDYDKAVATIRKIIDEQYWPAVQKELKKKGVMVMDRVKDEFCARLTNEWLDHHGFYDRNFEGP